MEELYTVSQVARLIGIAPNTVRVYSRDYPDHLSDHATPGRGMERKFTEADIATLQTIRILRQQKKDYDTIDTLLSDGQRLEPAEPTETPPEAIETPKIDDTSALAPVDLLNRFIVRYEEQIDDLTDQLAQSQETIGELKERAAKAEGRLEELDRRPWWKFWGRE